MVCGWSVSLGWEGVLHDDYSYNWKTNGLDIIKGVPQNANRGDRVHLWPGEESACIEEHIVSDWRWLLWTVPVYTSQCPVYSMHGVSVGDSWSADDRAGAEISTGHSNFSVDDLILEFPRVTWNMNPRSWPDLVRRFVFSATKRETRRRSEIFLKRPR